MTDKQPEALRLANLLNGHEYCNFPQMDEAAEELRRQYQEIQELKKAKEALLEENSTIRKFAANVNTTKMSFKWPTKRRTSDENGY